MRHEAKQELAVSTESLQKATDNLNKLLDGKLLREYRTEKDNLLHRIAYIKRIEELEDQRAKLEDGKPCPLCGSTEHPFAEGNVPVPDETELRIESLRTLISEAENQEAAIRDLEELESTARRKWDKSKLRKKNAANNKNATEEVQSEIGSELEKLQTSFRELKLAALDKLQPFGIKEIPESKISSLCDSLKSRMIKWQEQKKEKNKIEKQITVIDGEINRVDAVIIAQTKALTEKEVNLKQLKTDHAIRVNKRKELYGDKQPDDEENRLNKAISDAEEEEKRVRDRNTELQQELTRTQTRVDSLKKHIEQDKPRLKKREDDFSVALMSTGFATEDLFLDSRLTLEERESLTTQEKKLDQAQTGLAARRKDREKRLATETAKNVTNNSRDHLELQLGENQEYHKKLQESITALRHELTQNSTFKDRIKEKQSAVDTQKKECNRWQKLHSLIGSADGKKYRNFAQGLTFELMLSHANQRLEKMTDRYLLIRDMEQPLALNVVDNYQAGEIRSTKNLSGGEGFIVSLALALGLSNMASRKVRVDSLFLDEGFGTLDEEALESALETLSGLRQDGKLIGIISHVRALKERINTQINVTPATGGRSTLSGPSCTKIN